MPSFHKLSVTDIRKTIRDAVVVTLNPEPDEKELFKFTQGQHLTFRRTFDGEEIRRNYSICTGINDDIIQIGIKRVDGGAFSTWANEELQVGDVLESLPPSGTFHTPISPDASKHYIGFAGGSGITPILSILRTVMDDEPKSKFTLVYANQNFNTIMFREELEDLKNIYMSRLNIFHILESDNQEIDLFAGRIDAQKCDQIFEHCIDSNNVDTAFICGPEPMMLTITESLKKHGLKKDQIKFELFTGSQMGRLKNQRKRANNQSMKQEVNATVLLDGTVRNFKMNKSQSILEAALANNIDVPFSCQAGVCSTCKGKILEGEVDMAANHALEEYEIARSYILTCQSYPVSDTVVVDYNV